MRHRLTALDPGHLKLVPEEWRDGEHCVDERVGDPHDVVDVGEGAEEDHGDADAAEEGGAAPDAEDAGTGELAHARLLFGYSRIRKGTSYR